MDAALALKLAELLPELRAPCPNSLCAEGWSAQHSPIWGASPCGGRRWVVADLHLETIRAAMLAHGWRHRGTVLISQGGQPQFLHEFVRATGVFGKAEPETWEIGTDDLETCLRAAVQRLEAHRGD